MVMVFAISSQIQQRDCCNGGGRITHQVKAHRDGEQQDVAEAGRLQAQSACSLHGIHATGHSTAVHVATRWSPSKLHSCWHTMQKWNGLVHDSAGQVHPNEVMCRSSLQVFSAESSSSHLRLRSLVGVRSKRRGPQQRRGGVVAVGCLPCLH